MEIYNDLNFEFEESAVCIGKFDGLHLGHRFLINEARKTGCPVVLFTFVFEKKDSIYSYHEKLHIIRKIGIDKLVIVPIDKEFMSISPEDFIENILIKKCHARYVMVGKDFCFGKDRKGNALFLKEMGQKYGFETNIYEKLKEEDEEISSTRIRKLLSMGHIHSANKLLKHPYFIKGKVVHGNQIGRKIEHPTANVYPEKGKVLPPFGVYAIIVEVDGKKYRGVGNLGVKPTISDNNPVGLEIWLFDFNENLYNKEIIANLIYYQREERKFKNLEELQKQIKKDTQAAKISLSRFT